MSDVEIMNIQSDFIFDEVFKTRTTREIDIEIMNIQSDFIFDEVFKTRTTREIDIEFVNDLSYKHLIT